MAVQDTEFHSGSHLLHQDVLKMETADWRIYVGYDDVDDGVYLTLTLKNRWNADGERVTRTVHCGTAQKAIERAMRFVAQHPVPEPYCTVDY